MIYASSNIAELIILLGGLLKTKPHTTCWVAFCLFPSVPDVAE